MNRNRHLTGASHSSMDTSSARYTGGSRLRGDSGHCCSFDETTTVNILKTRVESQRLSTDLFSQNELLPLAVILNEAWKEEYQVVKYPY